MKKLFTLASALLITCTYAIAQPSEAMLRVRLNDRSPIAVELDGRYYDKGTTALTLDGLRPGPHRITVFSIGGYNARPVRIYTGTLQLEPGTENMAVVDVYRRSLRLRTEPLAETNTDGTGHEDYDRRQLNNDAHDGGNNGYNRDGNRSNDDVYSDHSQQGGSSERGYGDDKNNNGTSSNANGEEGYGSFPHGRGGDKSDARSNTLSQRDMDDLATRVKGRITDTDKEQLLKNVLSNRTAYTEQVRQMLSWFSFDSTKLDFAKWAYSHAADRKNYWKLEDVFAFSSSKEEFSKYISGR